jgi:hypothetical protein
MNAVAASDFLLAGENIVLALAMQRRGTAPLACWSSVLFVGLAAAAFSGGIVHASTTTSAVEMVWRITLLGIDAATLGAWMSGAHLFASPRLFKVVGVLVPAACAGYAIAVLVGVLDFAIAVYQYLPAAVFLMFAFFRAARRLRRPGPLLGYCGILVMLFASGVQQMRSGSHDLHNTEYHVLTMAGVLLLYFGFRSCLITREPAKAARSAA